MKDSVIYAVLAAPIVAIVVWLYTLTRWGDAGTFYAVVFIDTIVMAGPVLARRRRDRTILRFSNPLSTEAPLLKDAKNLSKKMGLGEVSVFIADSQRLRRVNALQIGVSNPTIVISDVLLRGLQPQEQEAILAHELAHSKKRHLLKRTMVSYGYFLAGLDLPLFSGYKYLPFTWTSLLIQSGIVIFTVGVLLVVPYFAAQFEVEADDVAARTIGSGSLLASALTKIVTLYPVRPPLSGFWRRTHPSLIERVKRLQQMK